MSHPDRPATLRDVATAAGVHPATASRALNPETRLLVSEETARRVSEAADRLGYRPNPVARSLRTRRSHTIGVLIPDLNNPLFPPMIRGIEDRLAEHGYVALIGNTDVDMAKERLVFDQMRARHVDGFVLATAITGSPILAEAAAADVPVVLMNRTSPDYPFSSVAVDNEQGVRAAVAHLVSLGHTRIGHIAGPQDTSTGAARLRGFRAAMATHKAPVTEDQIAYASIRATMAGTVIKRGIEVGEMVSPGVSATAQGTSMLTIADLDHLVIASNLNQLDVGQVRLAQPVEIDPGLFDDQRINNTTFWGGYATGPLPLFPGLRADFYYLGLSRGNAKFARGTALETRHSLGARLFGARGALDWNFEFVGQFGSFGGSDILAWTAASDTGWSFTNAPARPRTFLRADIASGDHGGSALGTFNPLFPRGAYFNEASFIGPQNLIDLQPGVDLMLANSLKLTASCDFVWRQTVKDGLYGVALNLQVPAGASHARYDGTFPALSLSWQAQRHLNLSINYVAYFLGDFVTQSQPGPHNGHYVSAAATFRF